MTNMNVLGGTTWQFDTPAKKESAYEAPLIDTTGYDNPITNDDVVYNGDKQTSSHASMHDGKTHVALFPPSSVTIGHKNIAESPADTNYLELLDDEGKLGNPSDVLTPPVDSSTQELPADAKYLVLLDDECKIGNPSECLPPHVDNKTQEQSADNKSLKLLDDKDLSVKYHRYTPLDLPSSDHTGHSNNQEKPADTRYLKLLDDKGKSVKSHSYTPLDPPSCDATDHSNNQEKPANTRYLKLSLIHI